MSKPRIAVIGAGVAGLACARRLRSADADVQVFDKGRGPGGRLATRRAETRVGEARFDHGAPAFTVRDPGFAAETQAWRASGALADWTPRLDGFGLPPRVVGAPAMNALPKAMTAGVPVRLGTRVQHLRRGSDGWRLDLEGSDEAGPYDQVVLAVPAEQAATLLQDCAPRLADEAAAAVTAPCWSLMIAFESAFDPGYDVSRPAEGGPLAWLAREASKPGRGGACAWVCHASAAWSRSRLEAEAATASAQLLDLALDHLGPTPPVAHAAAHRWRYALVERPAGSAFAFDPQLGLGLCGDWRLGPRVELAWMSGTRLGEVIAAL